MFNGRIASSDESPTCDYPGFRSQSRGKPCARTPVPSRGDAFVPHTSHLSHGPTTSPRPQPGRRGYPLYSVGMYCRVTNQHSVPWLSKCARVFSRCPWLVSADGCAVIGTPRRAPQLCRGRWCWPLQPTCPRSHAADVWSGHREARSKTSHVLDTIWTHFYSF